MKAILRSTILAASAATALAMTTTPAQAAGSLSFTGTATIDCFGCGPSSGTASLSATGTVNGEFHVGAGAGATFDLNEPSGTCPATGSASGEVKGEVDSNGNARVWVEVTFDWTRAGATAVITTSGDINGGGSAAFKADSTNPCGAEQVSATFAGSVSGA